MKFKPPKIKDIRASKGSKLRGPESPLESDLPSPLRSAASLRKSKKKK